MSKRLLSDLFPSFVKKEYRQFQRVSQGPFGEGLEKARTYLKPGEQSPEGVNVQTGPQGGKYYEDTGGGGGGQSPMIPNPGGYEEGTNYTDTQVVNPDIPDTIPNPGGFETGNYTDNEIPNPDKYPSTTGPTANPPEEQGTPALQDSKASLQETANTMAEDIKSNPNFTGSEAEIDAAVADLEFEITTEDSALRQKHASQGQMEEVHNENSHLDHSEGDIDDNGNWTAPLNEESQQLVDGFRDSLSHGEDYALMAKMMQQHNNSPRRDPVILSNKGGNQRLSLQKAGPHKYTSRTMGANGKYVYEYSGGVQGKPDAPEGSSHEQSAAHHHEALRHHGALAAQSGKRAEKLAAKAPDHPMTLRGQATAQGHREAQAYHQDQFDQHQAAGAGYDPEEANRQKQGAIYGWD